MKHEDTEALTDAELAQYRSDALRKSATADLHELQELALRNDVYAKGAALSLVGLALEACELVRAVAAKNPAAVVDIASKLTQWPVVHSVFPGDREGLLDYLTNLQLGSRVPLHLGRWRLKARGTRWAYAYWHNVERCKKHQSHAEEFLLVNHWFSDPIQLFHGGTCTRPDFDAACALPQLAATPTILKKWKDAFALHVRRHYPHHTVLDNDDWKPLLKQVVAGSARDHAWAFGKMTGEVKRGFERIASAGTREGFQKGSE